MTLSTHSVVGAGLAVISRANPFAAFLIGFLSHFLLDAIPHWDYPLRSGNGETEELKKDLIIGKHFFIDLTYIGFDFLFGIFLGLLLLPSHHIGLMGLIQSPILWGIFGAVTPDFLQFVYFKIRKEPLTSLQRFHMNIHAKYRFPHKSFIGPMIQILIIASVLSMFLLR